MEAVLASGRKISEMASEIQIFPQVLVNARVKNENKKKYSNDPQIAAAIEEIEKKMEGNGRVLILSLIHI